MSEVRSHRSIVAQLAQLPTLTLGGQSMSGAELALIVAINPELPYAEAMRTPQVIAELGRCTAAALAAKETAELEYRIWRDGTVHRLTNSASEAAAAGFECATNPGVDAKGHQKEAKPPSISAVEVYLRTTPDYRRYNEATIKATETWSAFYAAFEAAKSRQWAIRMKEDNGGNQTTPGEEVEGPAWDPNAAAPPMAGPPPIATTVAPPPPPPIVPSAGPPPPPPPPPPALTRPVMQGDNDGTAPPGMKSSTRPPPPPLPNS